MTITNEMIAHEGAVGPDAWERWAEKVERLAASVLALDHRGKPSLDGNQEVDGYSLDYAVEMWAGGKSAEDYATELIEDLPPRERVDDCPDLIFERLFDGNDLGG